MVIFTPKAKTNSGLSIIPSIVLSLTFSTSQKVPFRKCSRPPSISVLTTYGVFSKTSSKHRPVQGKTALAEFSISVSGLRKASFSIATVNFVKTVEKKVISVKREVLLCCPLFSRWVMAPFDFRLKAKFIVRTIVTKENIIFIVLAVSALLSRFIKKALVTPQKVAISTATTAGIVSCFIK